MSHICSLSKIWFDLNAHSDSMLDTEDHSLPTHMHSFTVYYVDNVRYDDIALNSVAVAVFELPLSHHSRFFFLH